MKARYFRPTLLLIIALLATTAFPIFEAEATNGYFMHGCGTQTKAMAGAGVALPQNALSAATNPAAASHIGPRIDFSVALFNPNRQYTVTGNPSMMDGTFGLTPGTIESGSKVFFVPSIAANWAIDDKSAVGLSIHGNGGMNTDYETGTFYGTNPTGVDLTQMFLSATYARQLTPRHSIGLSAIVSFQWFEANGLQAFGGFSSDGTKLSNNKHDNSNGFGVRVGYLGQVTSGLSIGAAYQTKLAMGEFEQYSGLFAEAGDFDIPANWTVGLALDVSRKLTLAADFQQILYSGVSAVANPMVPADFYSGILLGNANGAGFGWEDMNVYKFGFEWEGIPQLPLRIGYSYGEQPIPESEVMFNILAPGVIEQHVTFGFSREMCNGKELSFAVSRGLSNSVTGPNPMEVPGQQEIELKMDQWEFEIGFSF